MPISPKDRVLLKLCEAAKRESYDPDRQVGVVIASANGNPLATGSNRPPEVLKLNREATHYAIAKDPDWKYFVLEHAERNAINNALQLGCTLSGATMYGTLFPCADCARAIVAAGIRRLVVPYPAADIGRDRRWQLHYRYARQIFELSGIVLDEFAPEEIRTTAITDTHKGS